MRGRHSWQNKPPTERPISLSSASGSGYSTGIRCQPCCCRRRCSQGAPARLGGAGAAEHPSINRGSPKAATSPVQSWRGAGREEATLSPCAPVCCTPRVGAPPSGCGSAFQRKVLWGGGGEQRHRRRTARNGNPLPSLQWDVGVPRAVRDSVLMSRSN